jgi:hypothetical protein
MSRRRLLPTALLGATGDDAPCVGAAQPPRPPVMFTVAFSAMLPPLSRLKLRAIGSPGIPENPVCSTERSIFRMQLTFVVRLTLMGRPVLLGRSVRVVTSESYASASAGTFTGMVMEPELLVAMCMVSVHRLAFHLPELRVIFRSSACRAGLSMSTL